MGTVKETKDKAREVVNNVKSNVIISRELQNDINFMCEKKPDDEWSGVLVYEITKGDIGNPKGLELTARGFFLLDIGSPAYTEFTIGEKIIDIYDTFEGLETNPENWKMGKIHSHNKMQVYHSATDVQDLHDQAPSFDYYLSLIVNNENEFDCELC